MVPVSRSHGVRFLTRTVAAAWLPLAASIAAAQGTAWAPSRSSSAVTTASNLGTTTRYAERPQVGSAESAIRRAQYSGDWKRPEPTPRIAAGMHDDRSRVMTAQGGRRTSQTPASLAQYGIQLSEGEQLVGQPKLSEGRPMDSTKQDVLPTPDGLSTEGAPQGSSSSGPVVRDGEIIHEGPIFHDGRMLQDGDVVHDGEVIHEGPTYHGEGVFDGDEFGFEHDGHHGDCSSGRCRSCGPRGPVAGPLDPWADPPACPECGMCGYHRIGCGRVAWCLYNCLGPLVREWSIFTGAQGFKGPLDSGPVPGVPAPAGAGANGNFGFNEGFNLAGPIIPFPRIGLGYQVGNRWTQSDLSGNIYGSGTRHQDFLTAGIYHRAYRNCGFQWGVVYDWMTENYYTKNSLAQVRSEFSLIGPRGHEIGFMNTAGVKEDTSNANAAQIMRPADQFNFFYRYTTEYGGQGRLWGGFTSSGFGTTGGDFRVALSNRCDFVGGFNYIFPGNGQALNGQAQESFGLALNMVWYVGRPRQGIHNTPFRPLFNVADNNVFMLDRF